MQKKVLAFMKRQQLLQENKTILVATSGGPDSTALLHFYRSLQQEWNLNIIALSVDHQLRGAQSREDLQYVAKLCHTWDIPLIQASLDVRKIKVKERVSTQVAARKARYQFFKEEMLAREADYLALGHHADDQVETMFMGLTRSASPTALSGIPVRRKFAKGEIIRPFLCLTKKDIYVYCQKHQIQPRFDPSNEDVNDTRVFFRKSIIPLIKEKNNNIHTTVQRLSESLQADEHYLQKMAEEMVRSVVSFDAEIREAIFDIYAFQKHPQSLQRRAYHLILNYLYDVLPANLSYVHEDIFFSLLEHKEGSTVVDFPNELQIKKVYHKIVFSFTATEQDERSYEKRLKIPGKVILPNVGTLESRQVDEFVSGGFHQFTFQAREVAMPLIVRTRRPGDRMSWKGLGGTKKLKDIFIDEKVPADQRDQWPIVVDQEGKIIWVIGLRKATLLADPHKGPFIQLVYKEDTLQEGQHA